MNSCDVPAPPRHLVKNSEGMTVVRCISMATCRWLEAEVKLHWEGSPHIQDSRAASQERSQKKTHSSTLVEKVRNSALFYFCIVLGNLALFILFEVGLSGRSRRAPPTLTESILDPAWVAPCASLTPSIREVSQVHKSLTGNCHFRHGFRPQ